MDIAAVIVTVILAGAMAAYKYLTKKKMSPILLIIVSAVVGMVAYGIA